MTVADWYAHYAYEGRAWLPRTGQQQRHWLVRVRDVTQQRECYAHCFSNAAPIQLYAPEVPVPGWTRIAAAKDIDELARAAQRDGRLA
ncbi:MAG: hypothetical protein EBS05_24825 [Proteobacteria bacterium]|nr:hypothetical protein [Pseudomonadota bacterium]